MLYAYHVIVFVGVWFKILKRKGGKPSTYFCTLTLLQLTSIETSYTTYDRVYDDYDSTKTRNQLSYDFYTFLIQFTCRRSSSETEQIKIA